MSPLSAGGIQNAPACRKAEDINESGDLTPIALEREQRLVLAQILGVEMVPPPLGSTRAVISVETSAYAGGMLLFAVPQIRRRRVPCKRRTPFRAPRESRTECSIGARTRE